MKCPKCGMEIQEGHLYCEVCGEEIQIVPDFEPEIEYSLNETLSGIVEEVLEVVPEASKEEEVEEKKPHRNLILLAGGLLGLFICLGIYAGVSRYYRNNSVSYQLSRANTCFAEGNAEEAAGYYERAVELEPDNVSLRFLLAGAYEQAGWEDAYLNCLLDILRFPSVTEEEITSVYKRIIAVYRDREDYASINTLLMNTENTDIRVMFQNYMALPPEFSFQAGNYAEVLPLKLTASIPGTIYYTTDGTIPDENSSVYTTPIFLDTGSHTISALFVNEYGIKSEVVARSYVVDVLKPTAPEVETYSGEYTVPTLISVVVPQDGRVYYTMDGTDPTEASAVYNDPIPMPLGKSNFKFVVYDKNGVASDYTTREYELILQTEFTEAQAVDALVELLVKTGRITDTYGRLPNEQPGRYLYMFRYTLSIPEQGHFYIVSEVYEDTAGMQARTGTVYAVNIYTGDCFKLSRGVSDDYILEPL